MSTIDKIKAYRKKHGCSLVEAIEGVKLSPKKTTCLDCDQKKYVDKDGICEACQERKIEESEFDGNTLEVFLREQTTDTNYGEPSGALERVEDKADKTGKVLCRLITVLYNNGVLGKDEVLEIGRGY